MKSLFTLLALAAALPVQAQSSVTIYGRLNVTVESIKLGDEDRVGEVVDNNSRIGFKGVEDLGGGYKAGFQIEHGFDATTGAAGSAFWGRQAEVNLGTPYGTLRLGRFVPESYYATADYISMHNHDTGDSADAFYTSGFVQSNKVGYASPLMGGFQFHASVAEGTGGADRTYDLAANYDMGNWHFGAGFEKQGDNKQFALRGLYTMGNVTLGAYVQRADIEIAGSATHFRFAGMWTFGASELHLNIGRAGEYSNVDDSDAIQWTLGYNYNLSKRTKVYTYYTRLDKDDIVQFYDGDRDALAVGVRHNF